MTTRTKTKEILARMVSLAAGYDRRGDVVLRDQTIRQARELGLPRKYIDAALRAAGVIR